MFDKESKIKKLKQHIRRIKQELSRRKAFTLRLEEVHCDTPEASGEDCRSEEWMYSNEIFEELSWQENGSVNNLEELIKAMEKEIDYEQRGVCDRSIVSDEEL